MLENKTILITGSSRGIGAATAKVASSQGAKVILHGKTESDHIKELAKELRTEYIFFDVSDRAAVNDGIAEAIKRFPKIDGLCNVAGAVNPKPFLETTDEDWLYSYKVNVLGIVHLCQALIPHMQKNKFGRIVNIGSVRAYPQGTFATRLSYSASKAAVVNITAALAKEYAQDNILINSVSPGGVNTDLTKTWDETTLKRNSNVLLKRLAKPSEIAEMVCFLMSDKASYITGHDYPVDGGYLIGNN